jgi:phosphate-selective porin
VKPEDKRYKYSGYAQIHFESTDAGQGISQFIVRRFYHTLDYDFDQKTEGHFLLNTVSTVTLLEAYLQNKTGSVQVRAGQFIPPISFELTRSSSVRHVHDYARAYTNIWGSSHRDLGVQVSTRTSNTHAGKVYAALVNGNGLNKPDNNRGKDLHLQYVQPFAEGKGKLNVAYISGSFTTSPTTGDPVTTPRRLLNFGAAWANNTWDFQSEVLSGEAQGTRQLSFYGDAAYTTGRHTVYGRYQFHDPDVTTLGNLMSGPVIGYEYAIGPKNKVSVEADLYNDQATPGRDRRFAVRWQARW